MRAALLALLLLPPGAAAKTVHLLARDDAYEPRRVEAEAGDTVLVTFEGEGHTVTDATGGRFDTGIRLGGTNATFQVPSEPGEYRFYCKLHASPGDPADGPSMTGVLVVAGAATPRPQPGFEAWVLAGALAAGALLLRRR